MSRTAVEQIKERLSILDVVGSYVELTRAGKNYKAKSPFTSEKTPSFYVSPDRGMYYCFSSQQGGDMFTFIEKMEGVDFKGALKILADRAGVELVPEDPHKRDERETLYAILEEATQYFFRSREECTLVTEYVKGRGVTVETMHAWRIGYAKDEWRGLRQYLLEKGFKDGDLFKAGLIKTAGEAKEPYDVFRDRVMFPIFDASGRVVAFSGRTLKSDPGTPKYVNSPETELYQKSLILYGYDKAKQGIRHYDFSLLVEGQFDLVLAHQAGYTNTVAVSGTAFTKDHLTLLERLSSRIVLALDSDRAGITAMKRISPLMLAHGMDVKVATMEGGKDPADIIKQNPHDFKKFIGGAVHIIPFLLTVLKEGSRDERTYMLRVREELLPFLVVMQNRIDREYFEGEIAGAIGTTKEAIHYEVERLEEIEKRRSTEEHTRSLREVPQAMPKQASDRRLHINTRLRALYLATQNGAYMYVADFIIEKLRTLLSEGNIFGDEMNEAVQAELFTLEETLPTIHKKELHDEVAHLLTQYIELSGKDRLRSVRGAIEEAEREHDEPRITTLLTEVREIEKLLRVTISSEDITAHKK